MEQLTGNILVVGLGVSGAAAANYAVRAIRNGAPASVTVIDASDDDRLRERAALLESQGVRVILDAACVQGHYDLAIMSPGVAPHSTLFQQARSASAEMISEIEFAYRRSRAPWLAVTGTNGKTTVASLLGHLLTCGGVSVHVVGNIGTPAIAVVDEVGTAGALVAEVSSFQLALTRRFHPRVSILLNVTPDHLDWHGDMATYAADKGRILANQGRDDTAVIDVDDPVSATFTKSVRDAGVRVVPVSRVNPEPTGAWLDADGTLVAAGLSGPVRLCNRREMLISGDHNVSNALAAASAALAFGVEPEAVRAGMVTFAPIEHRLEPVGTVADIEFFNDSKATNPDAAIKALTAFSGRQVVILLGGRNKGSSFAALGHAIAEESALAVVYGEAADDIARDLSVAGVTHERAKDLAGAFQCAIDLVGGLPDAVVVLSPACASFDQFTNYAQRGIAFKALVSKWAEEVG